MNNWKVHNRNSPPNMIAASVSRRSPCHVDITDRPLCHFCIQNVTIKLKIWSFDHIYTWMWWPTGTNLWRRAPVLWAPSSWQSSGPQQSTYPPLDHKPCPCASIPQCHHESQTYYQSWRGTQTWKQMEVMRKDVWSEDLWYLSHATNSLDGLTFNIILVIGDAAVNDGFLAGVDDDEWQVNDWVSRRGSFRLLFSLAVPLYKVLEGNLLQLKKNTLIFKCSSLKKKSYKTKRATSDL